MNQQISEEAGEWLIKHRESGLGFAEKAAFDAWLRQSPEHVRAYLEMSAVWEGVSSLAPTWNADADELIARARTENNVVTLPVSVASATVEQRAEHQPADRSNPRRVWPRIFAVAAYAVIALSAGFLYSQRGVYSADVGEQRSLLLADGSTVELNSRSRIKVRYSDDVRLVELLQGQALFHVAKNKARPFIVQSSTTRVRAVGTSFDVYESRSGTVVTVVEGRVAVETRTLKTSDSATIASGQVATSTPESPAARPSTRKRAAMTAGAGEVFVVAGEQVVVKPEILTAPIKANIGAATAWTRRSLVFDSSPLTEVADEFNRYNTRRLVVEDADLVEFRVSGVFSSSEPSLLLRFLRAQPELVVEETDSDIRIRRK